LTLDAIGRSKERPSQATGYGAGFSGASAPWALTRGRVLARIESASPIMLGPCDEWRNLTVTDGSNPNIYTSRIRALSRGGGYRPFLDQHQESADGIAERLDKTMLNEFYRIAFRKKLYTSIAALQDDLDEWNRSYNEERPRRGRWCFGTTPAQTLLDASPLRGRK
jgi:hypothetical protein